MQKILVVAAIALFAASLAAPVFEDSWDAQDELLQRLRSGSAPVLSLMQDPDAAAAAASKNAANAAKAESEETAATAEESAAHSKAGELGKVDKANTDAAAEENMKQAKKAASDAADALKKSADAHKATIEAKAKSAKFQDEMVKLEAGLAKEDAHAKTATAARLKKVAAELEANKKEIANQEQAGKDAEDALKKSQEDLDAATAAAQGAYKNKIGELNKATASAEKAFAEEKASADEKYNEELAKQKKAADKAMAELKAESKADEAKAAAEQAAIKAKYDALDESHSKVKAAESATKAAEAKALAAERGSEDKQKADLAAANDAKIEANLKNIDETLGAAARQADADAKAAVAKAAADDVARTKASQAEADFDSKLVDCNPHGGDRHCFDPVTRTCANTVCNKKNKGTLYMENPSQHCTTKVIDCEDSGYGYGKHGNKALEEAGIATTAAPTPSPPSAACIAAQKSSGFKKASSLSAAACGPIKKPEDEYALRKHAEAYLDMIGACTADTQAPICNDKTAQTVDSGVASDQEVNKNCVDTDDYAGLKQQISDLPVYEASGTNGRFVGGLSSTACRIACSFENGYKHAGFTMPGASDECKEFKDSDLDAVHVKTDKVKGTKLLGLGAVSRRRKPKPSRL